MEINEEVLSRYGKSEGVNNAVLVLYKEPKQPKQEVCRFCEKNESAFTTAKQALLLPYRMKIYTEFN